MSILLTGGLGFIGSHTAIELLNNNYNVTIIDNLSNSSLDILDKIKQITNKGDKIKFYRGDITDKDFLDSIFATNCIDTVIHFAAFKAVNESITNPLKYYQNNIIGLMSSLDIMIKHNVTKIIFSSSATVYGIPEKLPITEDALVDPINPYGHTKLMGEQILRDVSRSDNIKIIILRYFNPVGSHPSGIIGENPLNPPTNLFPYILDTIRGKRDGLIIFGNNYNTADGTAIRDYIHVMDLAKGHLSSVQKLDSFDNNKGSIELYNLGTGTGYSVLEVVDTFNNILERTGNKKRIKYKFGLRRDGDAAVAYADPSLAKEKLDWKSLYGLEQMVVDSLNFLNKNAER